MVDFLGDLDKSLYFLVSGYLRIIAFYEKNRTKDKEISNNKFTWIYGAIVVAGLCWVNRQIWKVTKNSELRKCQS